MFKVALIPIDIVIEAVLQTVKLKINSFGLGLKAGFFFQFCTLFAFWNSLCLNHTLWAYEILTIRVSTFEICIYFISTITFAHNYSSFLKSLS